MSADKVHKAVQELARLSDKTLDEAYGGDISGDALLIGAMLKYIVAALCIIATTIAEKK